MTYKNEAQFESYIRKLIENNITKHEESVYALKNKKAVDILICKDAPNPELFFIEVKYHQKKHGRLGFGGGKGEGFQPEIIRKKPTYFENNLRWVLASEDHEPEKVLFLTSEIVRKYVSGGKVAEKYNNIQTKIFTKETWIDKEMFVEKLQVWLGVTVAQHIVPHSLLENTD